MIHVRYNGQSYDINRQNLNLNGNLSTTAIKQAVAQYLEVGADKLQGYVVDFRPSGDIIVRPEAVYG
ncbi:MAG: hypothetical protein R3E32_07150 [Chitinophagales bacterium]